MPRLTITINMENSAFEPSWEHEVSRILKEVADEPRERKLMDINGNKVGEVTIES